MKIIDVLVVALVASVASASRYHHHTGSSNQFSSADSTGAYQFGYSEQHASGGSFRQESGANGVTKGSYGLTDADGRQRTVNYIADGTGFRAHVQTNEPGVGSSPEPANVAIHQAQQVKVAPVPREGLGALVSTYPIRQPVGAIALTSLPIQAIYNKYHSQLPYTIPPAPSAISYLFSTQHGHTLPGPGKAPVQVNPEGFLFEPLSEQPAQPQEQQPVAQEPQDQQPLAQDPEQQQPLVQEQQQQQQQLQEPQDQHQPQDPDEGF